MPSIAWTVTGGDGAGQSFVDLERGWTLDHEDLVAHGVTLLFGRSTTARGRTAPPCSARCARSTTPLGCVGIAPEIASVDVIVHWRIARRTTSPPRSSAACARWTSVTCCSWRRRPSRRLRCSVRRSRRRRQLRSDPAGDRTRHHRGRGRRQRQRRPRHGHQFARRAGAQPGERRLPRLRRDHRRGGVVGRAAHPLGFSSSARGSTATPGARTSTRASSTSAGSTDRLYTATFSGTSSASPIIAGAALAVQGVATAAGGLPLQPGADAGDADPTRPRRRRRTTPPSTDRRHARPARDHRGRQLDVGSPTSTSATTSATPATPHTGSISTSPDVILRPDQRRRSAGGIRRGQRHRESNTLGYEADAGQDNFIYARVPQPWRRRGRRDAIDGVLVGGRHTGDARHVEPGRLGDADRRCRPATCSPCRRRDRLGPGRGPGTGHYCFVAIVSTADDPAPPLADLVDFDNFLAFIRNNNNVTWRNFNVVPRRKSATSV